MRSTGAGGRARQLADHLASHVRVRVNSLDAPLVVLILGPTGAGKSTVFNTLAGRPASRTGVLRPTTRVAVVLVHPDDRDPLLEGTLKGVSLDRMDLIEDETIQPGLALVDAPDIDSIEHANRDLADRLVEAADLCLFVTTATRYADQVPWSVLERIRQRGLPLTFIVNRMPPDAADRGEVIRDVRRLLGEAGLSDAIAAGGMARAPASEGRPSDAPPNGTGVPGLTFSASRRGRSNLEGSPSDRQRWHRSSEPSPTCAATAWHEPPWRPVRSWDHSRDSGSWSMGSLTTVSTRTSMSRRSVGR